MNNKGTSYPQIYVEGFSESVGYAFQLIANEKCDVFKTLDVLLSSSVFRGVYNASPKYLNMSSRQLIECISYDEKFNWFDTIPTGEETDQYILEWAGSLLTYFQWKYKINFKDWLKYFSVRDIYNMYYPLHEASYDTAADKLWENYRYKKKEAKCTK